MNRCYDNHDNDDSNDNVRVPTNKTPTLIRYLGIFGTWTIFLTNILSTRYTSLKKLFDNSDIHQLQPEFRDEYYKYQNS